MLSAITAIGMLRGIKNHLIADMEAAYNCGAIATKVMGQGNAWVKLKQGFNI